MFSVRRILKITLLILLIGCSRQSGDTAKSGVDPELLRQIAEIDKYRSSKKSLGKQYPVSEHSLKNGLKMLVVEKPTMPVVSVLLFYNVGSYDEGEGMKGMAHLFEHMMFRGSKNYGPDEHMRLIEVKGGYSNAWTSDETTVYAQRLSANQLELVFQLEADRMDGLKLTEKVLDTEREVVKEEYRLRVENDPIGKMMMKSRKILFPNHPYRWGPIGRVQDIDGFTTKACRDFYLTYYAPNNAVLVVVGDVGTQKAIRLAEKHFARIPSRQIPPKPDSPPVGETVNGINTDETELPIPVTLKSFYVPGVRHSDHLPILLLYNSLAGGRDSRLWKTLIKRSKLAEFFTGFDMSGRHTGLVAFAIAHLPHLSDEIESVIEQEIEKIKTAGLEEDEFMKAKNGLYASKIYQRYHSFDMAFGIGYAEVVKGSYRKYYSMFEEIERINQADVIRVANKYFTNENMKTIYFEPIDGMFLAWWGGLFKSMVN
ncbi:MAG: insulinase family protein [Proteobacteria bacterium]|nr:insulinase family protein [Pseudomonadota bacterium]